eukprot:6924129-Alexandrium_andersonii.AAC.1
MSTPRSEGQARALALPALGVGGPRRASGWRPTRASAGPSSPPASSAPRRHQRTLAQWAHTARTHTRPAPRAPPSEPI